MRREVWGILTPILGLNLWIVICLAPLHIEWASQDTRWLVLLLYALPLVSLGVGSILRTPMFLLLLFPASLIPAYLVLPAIDQDLYREFGNFVALALSVVLYIVVAARWGGTKAPIAPRGRTVRDGRDMKAELADPPRRSKNLWWPYRLFFLPRWVLLVLLLVVPLYGLNFAPDIADQYTESFGKDRDQAQVMANLLMMFCWVVVGYLFFISPGLNLELEQRELDQTLSRCEAKLSSRSGIWIIVAGSGLAVLLIGVLVAMKL